MAKGKGSGTKPTGQHTAGTHIVSGGAHTVKAGKDTRVKVTKR